MTSGLILTSCFAGMTTLSLHFRRQRPRFVAIPMNRIVLMVMKNANTSDMMTVFTNGFMRRQPEVLP